MVDITTTDAEKVTLCSWVSRDQRDQLQRLAIEADRSLSAEVRRAVAAHLERTAPEKPEQPA